MTMRIKKKNIKIDNYQLKKCKILNYNNMNNKKHLKK